MDGHALDSMFTVTIKQHSMINFFMRFILGLGCLRWLSIHYFVVAIDQVVFSYQLNTTSTLLFFPFAWPAWRLDLILLVQGLWPIQYRANVDVVELLVFIHRTNLLLLLGGVRIFVLLYLYMVWYRCNCCLASVDIIRISLKLFIVAVTFDDTLIISDSLQILGVHLYL